MNKIQYTESYIIEKYTALCYRLGRVASKKDIDGCDELPTGDTVKRRFGTMANLHEKTGIIKNNETPGKPLKKEIEKLLMQKRIYKGRRLDYMEVRVDEELPSIEYIRKVYNGKSLDKIWTEIETKLPPNIADYLGI